MNNGPDPAHGPSRIPEFDSIEEEAEWWDTHDITDYLDELRPVTLKFAPSSESLYRFTMYVRFDDWKVVERIAGERGRDPKELAAEWIAERVRQEAHVPAATSA
jgi:hypothetical protein